VKIGSSGAASGFGATGGGAALRGRGDDEGNMGRWASMSWSSSGSSGMDDVPVACHARLSHI
jgi:hypothetical protein